MRILEFLVSNVLYIIWFIIYFCIAWGIVWLITNGDTVTSLIIVSAIYTFSVTLALSPIGEELLRLMESCRLPVTNEEKNYLMPLFEEVYENAKELDPKLNDGIQLYIMDAMYVNAFAIGRKTIAVTRGAIETFTADELKGILAHEFGHMTHGHTKALLLSVIGNLFFSVIVWILRLLLNIVQFISNMFGFISVLGFVIMVVAFFIRLYINALIFIFDVLSQIILSVNSRTNETQADTFAYEIGYGRELISGLYLLQKISINADVGLLDKARASHPHTAYRIGHLEKLED